MLTHIAEREREKEIRFTLNLYHCTVSIVTDTMPKQRCRLMMKQLSLNYVAAILHRYGVKISLSSLLVHFPIVYRLPIVDLNPLVLTELETG